MVVALASSSTVEAYRGIFENDIMGRGGGGSSVVGYYRGSRPTSYLGYSTKAGSYNDLLRMPM